MFCHPVKSVYTLEVSETMPMDCRAATVSCTISWPKIFAIPEVGDEIPVSMRIVVVLPAPLGPKNPKVSPAATEKLISLTAVASPNFLTR